MSGSVPKEAFRREVASRLKEARRERTLTQRQLADLGQSTQQNISRYEKGFIPDSWFLLARLHGEKAIDLNWLLDMQAIAPATAGVPSPDETSSALSEAMTSPRAQALAGSVPALAALRPVSAPATAVMVPAADAGDFTAVAVPHADPEAPR